MIYLDYSATTPVSLEVQDAVNKATNEFIGNPNSLNALGKKSKDLMESAIEQISEILTCQKEELIFTSGATESNNMALIGSALANHKWGKHIITTRLEHPSIYAICDYLQSIGFEIDYVDNDEEGLVDFEKLKKLIREDTILVSVCGVNSELGIRQPLKMIKQIIKKENPNTYLHSDLTQGIGKFPMNIYDVDLASFSAHKIYGPKGIGLFYKAKSIKSTPLMYGSGKFEYLKPGTPALPLIVGFSKALRLSQVELEKRINFIERLNEKLVYEFESIEGIKVNKTKYSIPQILNISLLNIRPETFIRAMDEHEIYLSTNTACASGEKSPSIMAVYKDSKRAETSIRISISHLTSLDEINRFIKTFKEEYQKLNTLK